MLVQTGKEQPLPDYMHYLRMAERMTCPPWDLFGAEEHQPPKWWWRQARSQLDRAEFEATRKRKMGT